MSLFGNRKDVCVAVYSIRSIGVEAFLLHFLRRRIHRESPECVCVLSSIDIFVRMLER